MATPPFPGNHLTFGALLRDYRLRAGLTQEALAERSGLSARGISDLERGLNRAPRRDTVAMLLGALELSADDRATLVAAADFAKKRADTGVGQSLPVPPTPLIGRERETAAVVEALDGESVRLLTLIGPGGVGKTRLALAAAQKLADRLADGVIFVDLAPIREPNHVLPAIAAAVGVRDSGSRPLIELLAAALAHRQVLLVLDNCEQVVDAAPAIGELLAACPNVVILATSRIPLRIGAEQVLPVPPLELPDSDVPSITDGQDQPAAVALFESRARATDVAFTLTEANSDVVATLVQRLDGLPLAIELAAARVRALPPAALLARLDRQLAVLTGGLRDAPERQRTMRDAIGWSHDLLSPAERALFRQLAVFVGGFTLDAAEAISAATAPKIDVLEGLATLVDASLLTVSVDTDQAPRYRMLEVVREFGLEELSKSSEETAVRDAHAAYFASLLAPAAKGAFLGPEESAWIDRFQVELGNVRAALAWSIDGGGSPEIGLRLAAAPWRLWLTQGGFVEGSNWLERALAHGTDAPPDARAEALLAFGGLAIGLATHRPDFEQAANALEEAMAIFDRIGDPTWIALAQIALGVTEQGRGCLGRSDELFEAAIANMEAAEDTAWAGCARFFLGTNAQMVGNLDRALALMEEALRQVREAGSKSGEALCLGGISATEFQLGNLDRAATVGCQSLALRHALGERRGVAFQMIDLARVVSARGDQRGATRLYASAYTIGKAHGIDSLGIEGVQDAELVQSLREALGEEAFSAAWDSGEDLSLDDAVAEALVQGELQS